MRAWKIGFIAFAAPIVMAACSTSPQATMTLDQKLAERGYVKGEQVRRIREWNLNGWSYVDDRHFIMNSGVRDRYLVTLRAPSFNLRSAVNIAFSTTVGSLSDTDKVIVRAPGRGMSETSLIESLHRLGPAPKPVEPD